MDTSNLNLVQTLEGMPLTFNPEAAAGLTATIQFDVSGDESGTYHLSIASGECIFHKGTTDSPTLTIATPVSCKNLNRQKTGQKRWQTDHC
jgi:hypothetical protein